MSANAPDWALDSPYIAELLSLCLTHDPLLRPSVEQVKTSITAHCVRAMACNTLPPAPCAAATHLAPPPATPAPPAAPAALPAVTLAQRVTFLVQQLDLLSSSEGGGGCAPRTRPDAVHSQRVPRVCRILALDDPSDSVPINADRLRYRVTHAALLPCGVTSEASTSTRCNSEAAPAARVPSSLAQGAMEAALASDLLTSDCAAVPAPAAVPSPTRHAAPCGSGTPPAGPHCSAAGEDGDAASHTAASRCAQALCNDSDSPSGHAAEPSAVAYCAALAQAQGVPTFEPSWAIGRELAWGAEDRAPAVAGPKGWAPTDVPAVGGSCDWTLAGLMGTHLGQDGCCAAARPVARPFALVQ